MLDLRRLHMLRTLARCGSVTATADRLGYTPSAVSQALRQLEQEAGAPLVARDGRGVVLTDIGQELVSRSHTVFAELERAQAAVRARAGADRRPLRLGAFTTALQTLVPTALRDSACERATFVEREPELALPELANDELDLAVVYGYDLVPRPNYDGLHHELVHREPVVLIGADAAEPAPVELAALARHRWLLPPEGTLCGEMVRRACETSGFLPQPVAISSDIAALALMASACAGVALVPELALAPLAKPIVTRRTRPQLHRHIRVAVRDGAQRDPAITRLISALKGAARGAT